MSRVRTVRPGDRAVSSAVATVFMIAVAVIGTGAVGLLVLDMGDGVEETPPQAGFTFSFHDRDPAGDTLSLTHVAGKGIPATSLTVQVRNVEAEHDGTWYTYDGDIDWTTIGAGDQRPGEFSLSTTIRDRVAAEEGIAEADRDDLRLDLDEATVRIVWDGRSKSMVLDSWSGPAA